MVLFQYPSYVDLVMDNELVVAVEVDQMMIRHLVLLLVQTAVVVLVVQVHPSEVVRPSSFCVVDVDSHRGCRNHHVVAGVLVVDLHVLLWADQSLVEETCSWVVAAGSSSLEVVHHHRDAVDVVVRLMMMIGLLMAVERQTELLTMVVMLMKQIKLFY